MNWSDEYRLARRCLFGGKDQPQDFAQAFTLFQREAQKGNALAMHDLGRMLADGLGREIDMQSAHVWYSREMCIRDSRTPAAPSGGLRGLCAAVPKIGGSRPASMASRLRL